MLELGVQLAACLMLWRVVRCGAAVPAVVHVQVGWLQSTRPLNPGRQVRMRQAAEGRSKRSWDEPGWAE